MLIDDIDALTARIEELRMLQRIAGEAEHFETRATQIEYLGNDLHSPTETNELLRSNGIAVSVPMPPAGLIKFAEDMKGRLETDRTAALSGTGGFGQKFKAPLERLCERLKAGAKQAWTEYVEKSAPPVNHEVLSVLAKVRGFAESVSRIRSSVTQYETHRMRTPTSADDIRSFSETLEMLRNALGSLGSNDLPQELVDFMRRAGLDGVPLDQLTDETLGWLREHELLSQFVIKTA